VALTKYYSCHNIKEKEMCCACGTHDEEEITKEDFVWKLEEKISWKTKK
jgi:hypothetical protein